MDVRESDRKTGNGEGQPDGESGETGGRLCGVRTGKADKQKGSRATNERGKWTTASGREENSS